MTRYLRNINEFVLLASLSCGVAFIVRVYPNLTQLPWDFDPQKDKRIAVIARSYALEKWSALGIAAESLIQ